MEASDPYNWMIRFSRDGLTFALRLELCDMLTPRVSLREPFGLWFDEKEEEDGNESENISQLVDWKIILSANNIAGVIRELEGNQRWQNALPKLLPDFTKLLHEVYDLKKELGGVNDKSDLSYVIQPSISDHEQNRNFEDWTVLIYLNRDAWLATAAESSDKARDVALGWLRTPYPLFRRLAFFVAAQDDVVPLSEALEWLLEDAEWWLWSVETQREVMQLLAALSPQLGDDDLARLEDVILAGPPREMFREDIEQEKWIRLIEKEIWLRLAKIKQGGAELNSMANTRLENLSAKNPSWKLTENEEEEFPTWMGDGREFQTFSATPDTEDELVEWLIENPESDPWRTDDWPNRCRDDFDIASSALSKVAKRDIWLIERWRTALQCWSEEELTKSSWTKMAPIISEIPTEKLQEISHGVSWWLEKLSKTFEGDEKAFLKLCDRVLALSYEVETVNDDPVGRAINHPVGHTTEALLNWWYRGDLKDEQGLKVEVRKRFTYLCNTEMEKFRHGRVLLSAHVISLFRVDQEWADEYLLPLFTWENSETEARSAWEGFLWSPRYYSPLMEKLKPAFLETAMHYFYLGKHREQYISLLTFIGLDPGDVFQKSEVSSAMRVLPQEALDHASSTFFRAIDSAGEQRAEYWENRAVPYLHSIWPKSSNMISTTISENFALACIAAGNAFPDGLKKLHPWLQELKYPNRIAHVAHREGVDKQFPGTTLELLNKVFGDSVNTPIPDLSKCLNTIKAERPELENHYKFRRLKNITY